jgi:hypothetical protein
MAERDSRNRDPLAIAVAIMSLGVQVGAWFYWGGKMETRLDAVEKRVEQGEQRATVNSNSNASQDVAIAVITTQLSTIQSTVERIDRALQDKK